MSSFFIRRPIVAIVIAVCHGPRRSCLLITLPVAQYPQHRPAGNRNPDALHRRRCDDHRGISGRAHRAEDEWRGQDELHDSINANNGDLRLT